MIPCGARPPHPIYMRVHDRLRVTQSSKHKILYFLSSNSNLSFLNPNFLSPFVLAALGGGSSWPVDARSIQGSSSPMGSLPGGSLLVQVAETMHTGQTDNRDRSDQSELRQPEVSARGHVHV
jgi:hypothetical protein